MSKYDINWKYTYKKMPKNVKAFLTDLLGKEEARKLMDAIRTHKWIMMTGPECSGKSTVMNILWALGYPFVIDDNGIGRVIHTSQKLTDLKATDDILEELGIGRKRCTSNKGQL